MADPPKRFTLPVRNQPVILPLASQAKLLKGTPTPGVALEIEKLAAGADTPDMVEVKSHDVAAPVPATPETILRTADPVIKSDDVK